MTDPLFDIAGRAILVTGAANGLGRSLALALAQRGARLDLVDLAREPLEQVAAQCGPHARAHVGDITRQADVARIVEAAAAERSGLDGLVNCAGIFRTGPALALSAEAFRTTLDVNVTGAFLLSCAAARAMTGKGGRIVHLASVSSRVSNAEYAAYASSKAALAHLVRVLAREWAAEAITVNAIGPAMTQTGLTGGLLADPDRRAAALSVIPMGRFGTPEDLTATLLLLLGPGGAFITGQTIYVDGGRTLV